MYVLAIVMSLKIRLSFFCSYCSALLIERDWYELGLWAIGPKGRYLNSKAPVSGHFLERPGNWGRKRLPLSIGWEV